MTRAALLALAERCEREKPSYALDCKIEHLCEPERGRFIGNAKPCTTSLDAAVTLVPEGWAWFVEWIGAPFSEGRARLWIPSQRTQRLRVENVNTQAKTPTMALCAAALRARAALLDEGAEK